MKKTLAYILMLATALVMLAVCTSVMAQDELMAELDRAAEVQQDGIDLLADLKAKGYLKD